MTDGPPLYAWLYTTDALATFVGLIDLGLATARAAVLPRNAGYLLSARSLSPPPTIVINLPQGVALVPELVALGGLAWIAVSLTEG